MIDYLTYYYRGGTEPFRSLSALSDDQAIHIMEGLYDETGFGARFKDPAGYLRLRRQTERWVREGFIAKGGRPEESYPIPMVLGNSDWIVRQVSEADAASGGQIRIPLSAFEECDVSFTYPDSMISLWFGTEKPSEYYLPELHGRVFTRTEILSIVEARGLPEQEWETNLPSHLAPYIEAQVWNQQPLMAYRRLVWNEAAGVHNG